MRTVVNGCYRTREVLNLDLDATFLSHLIEFDVAFTITPHHLIVDPGEGSPAPEVHVVDDGDVHVCSDEWETWSDGMSNQWGYSGPILHPSEFLGGGMARELLATPGEYVITEVVDPDDPDSPAGWIILKRKEY